MRTMNENIVRVEYENKVIYLVKTAHVSKNSVEDVLSCYEELQPDSICVELDQARLDSIDHRDAWRQTDISEIIKKKQVGFLLVNTILASFQRRMAKNMDSSSGAEMIEGVKLAREHGLELVLADRPVKTTFSRIWRKLGLWEKAKLLVSIVSSVFDDEELTEEDLQKLKEADALETALQEVGKEFPVVKEVLVDERDQYLSRKIRDAKGQKIMAVIGAAHSGGIVKNLDKDVDLEELDSLPEAKGAGKYLKWAVPAVIIGMILFSLVRNTEVGLSQIRTWILWNGSLSALGVLLARGHILSVLTAFVMAPITSLNPLLAAGWFAGLMEARLRKPKVKDFEDIGQDTSTVKGFFTNNVTRILLVVVFANLFSTIGTFISGLDIFASFFDLFK